MINDQFDNDCVTDDAGTPNSTSSMQYHFLRSQSS